MMTSVGGNRARSNWDQTQGQTQSQTQHKQRPQVTLSQPLPTVGSGWLPHSQWFTYPSFIYKLVTETHVHKSIFIQFFQWSLAMTSAAGLDFKCFYYYIWNGEATFSVSIYVWFNSSLSLLSLLGYC